MPPNFPGPRRTGQSLFVESEGLVYLITSLVELPGALKMGFYRYMLGWESEHVLESSLLVAMQVYRLLPSQFRK